MTPHILAGKYLVEEEIASGGMGVIYKARDRTIDRMVAIKLVHAHLSGDPSFADRFLREAKAMARLQHQNIATIYEIEEDRGTQLLVMEFCPGDNLRTIIRNRAPLPVQEAIQLAAQLASALACAHAHGVVHRDIKPANVLVDTTGKAKLTDFGIAAALDEAGLTSAGQIIGTPDYMSPEQAQGKTVDGRSDLYSLGIVLYEMLTGKTPYPKTTGTAILARLAGDHTELNLLFPSHIPPIVQRVLRDLLRRNAVDRIAEAGQVADRLHQIQQTLPQSPTPGIEDNDSGNTVRIQDTVVLNHEGEQHTRSTTHQVGVFLKTVPGRFVLGVGIVLASLIIVWTLKANPEKASEQDGAPSARLAPETIAGLKAQLHEYEAALAVHEPRVRELAARLDTQPPPGDCSSLKMELVAAHKDYARTIGEINRIRKELMWEAVLPLHPAALDRACPDAQLQSLITTFTQAYEHRDLPSLRAISQMNDARLLNVETMFRTYKTLRLSLKSLSIEETSAVVTLFIETAVTKSGETVDLSPIGKTLTLRIPRQGGSWDKIMW